MCGRYFLEESPELRPIVEAMNRSPLVRKFQQSSAVLSQGEIRPTNVAPVIASNKSGHRTVFPMRWGFTGKSLLINAKTETAAAKPTFQEAWKSHRCIVPASWYFEWEHLPTADGKKKTGEKYILQPKGSAITWVCGLYRMEEGFPCYVILTREPSEEIRFIHDRMPLMLPEQYIDEWIKLDAHPEEIIRATQTEIIYEKVV
jgi:putative SOS response-associated peptidase YedK